MGQCRDFALTGSIVPILGACASVVPLGNEKRSCVKEFFGMVFIVGFTFTPGKWVGKEVWWHNWIWHGVGVIAADLLCGGGHVNPSMSYALYAVGSVTYGELLCRVASQVAGSVMAFTFWQAVAKEFQLEPLAFSAFDFTKPAADACWNEALASFVLVGGVFLWHFILPTKNHYWVKMPLTAAVVRLNIVLFPVTGPAMNPALATGWVVWASGQFQGGHVLPVDTGHYASYWISSLVGASFAALLYSLYAARPLFGLRLRRPTPEEKDKTR